MQIFLTGGSGFIGGHLIERLVAGGHEVRAMARSDASAAVVARLGAVPVRSSLGAVTTDAVAGSDAVIHAAARAEEHGTREQFWSANVDGTQQLLDVARAAAVPRFVHIGTEAGLFDGSDLLDIDETQPAIEKHRFLYSESKAEAERRVLEAASDKFFCLSLRPRLVWGPRDTSVLPALLRMAEQGWLWIDHGRARTSTCHVENLCEAVELALTTGDNGHAYFITDGAQHTFREFLTGLVQTQGVTLGTRSVPSAILRPVATAVEWVWRFFRLKTLPPLTAFAVYGMSASVTLDIARARQVLGYVPKVDLATGLADLTDQAQAKLPE